jgi:hypothetical protein
MAIACRRDRGQWAQRAQGAYLLRTNCNEKDPTKVWDWYLQLQQAEAAFRIGKSDLKLRPIIHRKTERVDAHILVCFLALALWRVLEMWMHGKGLGNCARQLVSEVATIKSMDVVLPVLRFATSWMSLQPFQHQYVGRRFESQSRIGSWARGWTRNECAHSCKTPVAKRV